MSGLFGGIPGAGATMGTVVNTQLGGRTVLLRSNARRNIADGDF